MSALKAYVRFFAALADENRLRLLRLMKDGEICVCFLQGALKTNQPKISRHLAYLRRARLVEARRQGKWMHYRIKQQTPKLQALLQNALKALENEIVIQRDGQRARQIQCAPGRFGLSAPEQRKSAQTDGAK
jgi:ArsR family transcriptional regulator